MNVPCHPENWIPDNFQAPTENSSLPSSLDLVLKNKAPPLSFLTFALFSLTSHCLARFCSEHCLYIYITSNSYVCLPLYNVSLIVFLNCKSLWIKASAKRMNVNVWKPRFLWQWPSAHLHFLVSCFSWQYPIDSLCSGLVSLLASQTHQHHGHLTSF